MSRASRSWSWSDGRFGAVVGIRRSGGARATGRPPGCFHQRHRGLLRPLGVAELVLFGSVLRDDFGPESDVDVLVRFKAGRTVGLFEADRMRRELAEIFAREVDLMTRAAIERSRNHIRRKAILEAAQVVYAA